MAVDKAHMRAVLVAAGSPRPGPPGGGRGARRRRSTPSSGFAAAHGWPLVLKTARGGYDGKGVWPVGDLAEAAAVLARSPGRSLVEEMVPLQAELAVMVARRPSGDGAWPAVETAQVGGVCREVLVPGRLPADVVEARPALGQQVAEIAGAVGVLAVELFWAGGSLLVNEIAARPHNSGHWTIEGAVTSQFENHLRAVLDLPLGSTAPQHAQVASVNVFGGPGREDPPASSPAAWPSRAPMSTCMAKGQARAQTGARDRVRRRRRRRAGAGLGGRLGPGHARPDGLDLPAGVAPMTAAPTPVVAVVMGSSSDLAVMQDAVDVLRDFGVPHEVRVVSAHRTPDDMIAFGHAAAGRGPQGDHRRRRRRRPPARDAVLGDHPAGHRRPCRPLAPRRARFAPLHRADAPGRAGGHRGGQRGPQRRAAGGAHPGAGRSALTASMEEFQEEIAAAARAQDAEVAEGGRTRSDDE